MSFEVPLKGHLHSASSSKSTLPSITTPGAMEQLASSRNLCCYDLSMATTGGPSSEAAPFTLSPQSRAC